MRRPFLSLAPLALLTTGCGDAEEPAAIEDPSKLSAELEAEAKGIEQRADAAAREAEALAEQELEELRAEVEAAQVGAGSSEQEGATAKGPAAQ